MFSQDSAISAAGHESVSTVQHSVGAGMTLFRTRAVLVTAMAAIFALALRPATGERDDL